jgi:hypothetical protein
MSDYPVGYFHGTKTPLGVGQAVLPCAIHGGRPTTAPVTFPDGLERLPDADDHVFVTTRFHLAWAYAFKAPEVGAPRVLRVEPDQPLLRDQEHSTRMGAYRCPAATVLEVFDKPPSRRREARRRGMTLTRSPTSRP